MAATSASILMDEEKRKRLLEEADQAIITANKQVIAGAICCTVLVVVLSATCLAVVFTDSATSGMDYGPGKRSTGQGNQTERGSEMGWEGPLLITWCWLCKGKADGSLYGFDPPSSRFIECLQGACVHRYCRKDHMTFVMHRCS